VKLSNAWVLVPYGPASTLNAPYDYTVALPDGLVFASREAAESAREISHPGYNIMLLEHYIQEHVQAAVKQTHTQIQYRMKEMWRQQFPNQGGWY
jgi:hypothetical protein